MKKVLIRLLTLLKTKLILLLLFLRHQLRLRHLHALLHKRKELTYVNFSYREIVDLAHHVASAMRRGQIKVREQKRLTREWPIVN